MLGLKLNHVSKRGHMWSKRMITHIKVGNALCSRCCSFNIHFSRMKKFVFWLKLHWNLIVRVQWTITQHWFRYPFVAYSAPNRRQTIIWTNADRIHWRIYASLSLNVLNLMTKTLRTWTRIKISISTGYVSLWCFIHEDWMIVSIMIIACCGIANKLFHKAMSNLRNKQNQFITTLLWLCDCEKIYLTRMLPV